MKACGGENKVIKEEPELALELKVEEEPKPIFEGQVDMGYEVLNDDVVMLEVEAALVINNPMGAWGLGLGAGPRNLESDVEMWEGETVNT